MLENTVRLHDALTRVQLARIVSLYPPLDAAVRDGLIAEVPPLGPDLPPHRLARVVAGGAASVVIVTALAAATPYVGAAALTSGLATVGGAFGMKGGIACVAVTGTTAGESLVVVARRVAGRRRVAAANVDAALDRLGEVAATGSLSEQLELWRIPAWQLLA